MNDLRIINIDGIECYEKDGTVYLKLETVAIGLGFTQIKNGTEYVRWETVNGYLADFGFPNKLGKDDFIPENIFYRIAMKAKNDVAEAFQAKIADDVIPSIRKRGYYSAYSSDEDLIAAIISHVEDKNKITVVIEALRRAKIDQAIFTAKLMGLTPEEFRRSKVLIDKSIANEEANRKMKVWSSHGSGYYKNMYTVDDLPERYKERFYMEGLIEELSRKKNYKEDFLNYYGKMYFDRDGYLDLIDVLRRRGWISEKESHSWSYEAHLM